MKSQRAALFLEELARDGRGVKRSAQRSLEFLRCLLARSRVLCALEELAQDGRGFQALRPKKYGVPPLFVGAQPRPLRF
jgi:hypothetical protein